MVPRDKHETKDRLINGRGLRVPSIWVHEDNFLDTDIKMFQIYSVQFTEYKAEQPNFYPSIRLSQWKKEWNNLFDSDVDGEDKKISELTVKPDFLRDVGSSLIDVSLIEESDILATIKNTSSLPVCLDIAHQLSSMNKLNQNSELKFAIQSRLLISKLRPEDFEEVLKHMD